MTQQPLKLEPKQYKYTLFDRILIVLNIVIYQKLLLL